MLTTNVGNMLFTSIATTLKTGVIPTKYIVIISTVRWQSKVGIQHWMDVCPIVNFCLGWHRYVQIQTGLQGQILSNFGLLELKGEMTSFNLRHFLKVLWLGLVPTVIQKWQKTSFWEVSTYIFSKTWRDGRFLNPDSYSVQKICQKNLVTSHMHDRMLKFTNQCNSKQVKIVLNISRVLLLYLWPNILFKLFHLFYSIKCLHLTNT